MAELHKCNTCRCDFATCRSDTKKVWGIDRHPEATGAEADKVLECAGYILDLSTRTSKQPINDRE